MTSPLLQAFDWQVQWCQGPAPFTALVLQRTRQWLQRDAQAHAALAAFTADPLAGAVPLRWAAALHHLALQGVAPFATLWRSALAPPAQRPPLATPAPTGFDAGAAEAISRAVQAAWLHHRSHMDQALSRAPQTNEVQRSAALLPGLLFIADQTKLPVALLELGASAGLNLWCDRYRHDHGAWSWGDVQAPLTLRSEWVGPVPAEAGTDLRIAHRAGCDPHPLNLHQAGEPLRLASFIWPDQTERMARLRSAMQAVEGWMRVADLAIQARPASAFVKRELATPRPGLATVLMHSVVWQYLDDEEQRAIFTQVEVAGQRATAKAPLAWLRFEPPTADGNVELRCRLWPGRGDRLLARCHPHASRIEWLE